MKPIFREPARRGTKGTWRQVARMYDADWQRGLGGTFVWSLDADYDGHSQDLMTRCITRR